MKRLLPARMGLVAAVIAMIGLLALPAIAAAQANRGSSGGGGGGTAVAGGSSGASSAGGGGGDHAGTGSTPRYAGGPAARTTGRAEETGGDKSGVPPNSRPRDPNVPSVGKAVPRPPDSIPTRGGTGTTYVVPGGYYGGYGFGYGYAGYGGLFGGYYDPWYDPWYGAYPGYSGG